MKQQQLQSRLQQAQRLRRRMAGMNTRRSAAVPPSGHSGDAAEPHAESAHSPATGGGMARDNPAINRQALHELLEVLRSPNSPERDRQILQILKSHPQLMAAFIKQRQTFQAMRQEHEEIRRQANMGA